MNCNDIERILNEEDVATLGVAERAGVTSHLATCRACALEWEAYRGYAAAPVPRMSDDILTRCRARFVAAARAHTVRTATRPLMLVGLFVGAAAAALVGSQFFGDSAHEDGTADRAAQELAPQSPPLDASTLDAPEAVVDAAEAPAEAMQGTAAQAASRPAAPPDTFVLAVSELKRDRADPAALAYVYAVYDETVRQLQSITTIRVVMVPLAQANESTSPTDERVVDLSFIPPALIDRMQTTPAGTSTAIAILDRGSLDPSTSSATERVVGGASTEFGSDPRAGVVNMILDRNVRGLRLDSPPMATAEYDYRLDFEATAVIQNGRQRWTFSYKGVRTANTPINSSFSADLTSGVDPTSLATHIIERLRNTVLPADPAWVESLRSRVLDTRVERSARLDALAHLGELHERTGYEGRDGEVTRAAAELAALATPAERARVWQLLRGAENDIAVGPLTNALLTDPAPTVQIEALRTLAADLSGNESARAALEQAAIRGATAEIRIEATWATRDASGRDSFVRDALLDDRVGDEERLAPLLFALEPAQLAGNPRYSGGVDDAAGAALRAIVNRAAGSRKRTLLMRLAVVDHATVTGAYLDALRDASDEETQVLAVSLLAPKLSEPGVRAALESARYDNSPRVREAVTRMLARQ